MLSKLVMASLMIVYIYTLEFDIFLNAGFPIPKPFLFAVPLIIFFGSFKLMYSYNKEVIIYFYACLLYFVLAQGNFKDFAVSVIILTTCSFYFQFFVGRSLNRFRASVFIFFFFLIVSSVVMYMNHLYPDKFDAVRVRLLGDPILQSPSGITANIFTFGYQAAALSVFLFLFTFYSRRYLLSILAFIGGGLVIYYGMQRSALVDFVICCGIFFFVYLGWKKMTALVLVLSIGFAALAPASLFDDNPNKRDANIFSKNKKNHENGEERSDLITENLKIYANYPFGLMFYDKKWTEVVRYNPAYPDGITSHNAYLMFFTYLGPFLGIAFLIALYYKIGKIFIFSLRQIKDRGDPLLLALVFSFLAVTINSCFHNAWLLEVANGVIIFLYIAVLHYDEAFVRPEKTKQYSLNLFNR